MTSALWPIVSGMIFGEREAGESIPVIVPIETAPSLGASMGLRNHTGYA
jgi:hypothetical protein